MKKYSTTAITIISHTTMMPTRSINNNTLLLIAKHIPSRTCEHEDILKRSIAFRSLPCNLVY